MNFIESSGKKYIIGPLGVRSPTESISFHLIKSEIRIISQCQQSPSSPRRSPHIYNIPHNGIKLYSVPFRPFCVLVFLP